MLIRTSFNLLIVLLPLVFLFIPQIFIVENVHCAKSTTTEKPFNLTKTLHELLIVPFFLPVVPKHVCKIMYGDLEVGGGKAVAQELVILRPPIVTWPCRKDTYYTLMMTDIDTHSEEMFVMKESFSWLVCDIPGCDIRKGKTVYSYFGEMAMPTYGFHRYIVYVFQQKKYPLNICMRAIHDDRRWVWRTFEFAQYFNLTLMPVAGNVFILDARRGMYD